MDSRDPQGDTGEGRLEGGAGGLVRVERGRIVIKPTHRPFKVLEEAVREPYVEGEVRAAEHARG